MYIENIELRDFCCFEQAKVMFQYKGKGDASIEPRLPNVNLILGDNGTGKTAILRGLALAVLGTVLQSGGLRPYMLVRRIGPEFDQPDPKQGMNGSVLAKIQLHQQDAHTSGPLERDWDDKLTGSIRGQTVINRQFTTEEIVSVARVNQVKWEPLKNDFSPAFFMVGYGASRHTGAAETYDPNALERSRSRRYQRVAGIFEYNTTLIPIRLWWTTMRDKNRTESAMKILNRLLPPGVSIAIEENINQSEILFTLHGVPLPFQALSDGYRTLIGLVADLLYHLAQVVPVKMELTDLYGVVLVDELDLSLHPIWQRTVVDRLAEAFPNLQFFITTHSPILTGTLQYNNITFTELDESSNTVRLRRSHERVFGLSADQVLGSSYFGLTTSRAPVAENRLRELAERSSEGDAKAREDYMRLLTEGFDPEDIIEPTR